MEMPKPTSAHKQLELLAGDWVGEEVMHPSPWAPEGATATGKLWNRVGLDGFAVIQDYVQERGGRPTFWGHGVFSWDPHEGCHVLHWWDSMGMPSNVFRGGFKGEVLSMVSEGPMGQSRTTIDLSTTGRYRFKMEVSADGDAWQPMVDAEYERTSD